MFYALPHPCPKCPNEDATVHTVAMSERIGVKLVCQCEECGTEFSVDYDGMVVAAKIGTMAVRANNLELFEDEVAQ